MNTIADYGKNGRRAALILALALSACATNDRLTRQAEPALQTPPPPSSAPTPPPPPAPPPVDLAGKWRLAATGGACVMTFGASAGASDGTIAPAGGCPGKFFTSRKWTFEHDRLLVRDYKGQTLVELSFADGRFEGKSPDGAAVSLSR